MREAIISELAEFNVRFLAKTQSTAKHAKILHTDPAVRHITSAPANLK